MQINELCAVGVMTEESLKVKQYPAPVLVPFPADSNGGIFNFIIN